MQTICLALLFMIASSEIPGVFLEYEKHPSSQVLLETVFLQLELGISSSELVANLEQVVYDLKAQEQVASAISANQENICEGVQEFESRLEEISKNIDSSQENLNVARPELELLTIDIIKKLAEIEGYKKEIKEVTQKRKEEKHQWAESDSKTVEKIEATIGAIKLTTQLKFDDSSLVLIQKKLNSLTETLNTAAKDMGDVYVPAVSALAQITKSDPQTINQVVSLLEGLKSDLIQSKGENAKLEEVAETNANKYIESIQNAIETDTQDLISLERKKHRLEFTVKSALEELAEDKTRVQAFNELLNDQKTLCQDWKKLNNIETHERDAFVKNIYEVIEAVNTNIVGVKEYFSTR